MRKIEYPLLDLKFKDFEKDLEKAFKQSFFLPKNVFPKEFLIKEKGSICGGYFACYNKTVSTEEINEFCKNRQWDKFGQLIGDFIIIFCDSSTKEIFVLTDLTGKFPCYFSHSTKQIVVSTDFGMVKDSITQRTLNIDYALDLFTWSNVLLITDQTIISEIHQLPPATLLKVTGEDFSLTPLLDGEKFWNKKVNRYFSVEEYTNDFLELLKKLVMERLEKIDNLKFGCDLSSGFDSPLVAYTLKKVSKTPFTCYSQAPPQFIEDTDPKHVLTFAEKHSLDVKFFTESIYPYLSKHDLSATADNPIQSPMGEINYAYQEMLSDDGVKLLFKGEGGDELYGIEEDSAKYILQENYFYVVRSSKRSDSTMFLTRGAEKLVLDRSRFMKKKSYIQILSETAIWVSWFIFPWAWETKVWPLMPFADPRIVALARHAPFKNKKSYSKQELWKNHDEIFLPVQFRKKGSPVGLQKYGLPRTSKFIISLFKKSILGEIGWVNSKKIVEDFQAERIEKYLEDGPITYFNPLVRLEYFLQNNNIKIPNI
jgi:asparagine synthetase B (glutamine-hydrolysing)